MPRRCWVAGRTTPGPASSRPRAGGPATRRLPATAQGRGLRVAACTPALSSRSRARSSRARVLLPKSSRRISSFRLPKECAKSARLDGAPLRRECLPPSDPVVAGRVDQRAVQVPEDAASCACGFRHERCVSAAVGRKRGGWRWRVACSKAWARRTSTGSLQARPTKDRPTGRPNTNPIGTLMLG